MRIDERKLPITVILNQLSKDKGIDSQDVMEAIKKAVVHACVTSFGSTGEGENVTVTIKDARPEDSFEVTAEKVVVDEVEDELTQISLVDARMKDPSKNIGDHVLIRIDTTGFGRIVTQEAKNIIVQAIREKERESLQEQYQDKAGQIIVGTVQRYLPNSGNISVNFDNIEALLTEKEMIHYKEKDENGVEQLKVEKFEPNQRIKVYVTEVRSTNRGPKILLSRTHANFVKKLFEQEVPEIQQGIVEIKAIAREAGSRTKIAVWSSDPYKEPVGACLGEKSIRKDHVAAELHGEKIDVIKWDENPAIFIENALSPAKVITVMGDIDQRSCLIVVPDNQLSLAIGKIGQNVRLAAHLTGFKIDIKSETQARESGELLDYQEDYYEEEEEFDEYDEEYDDSDLYAEDASASYDDIPVSDVIDEVDSASEADETIEESEEN